MKKILLSSAGFENPHIGQLFLKLIRKPVENIRILFVPTAAITPEELFYIEKSKQELFQMGIKEEQLHILTLDSPVDEKEIARSDVLYVCGGNTFHLLQIIRETNFTQFIKKFIAQGKLYFGVSAGSIILGPSIEIAVPFDENKEKMDNFTGLGLIQDVLSPHFVPEEKKLIDEYRAKLPYPITPLTDQQAFLVTDEESKIVE